MPPPGARGVPARTQLSVSASASGSHFISTASAFTGSSAGNPVAFRGYLPPKTGPVAFPGVLGIVPGDNWSNFIAAARSGLSYTLDEVVLTKESPGATGCPGVFQPKTVVQTGPQNIRLWWPLLYEAPGTTFTLDLAYRTVSPCRLAGERAASTTHRETWSWTVRDDLDSLADLSEVFHELSFGTSGVSLFSDESVYKDVNGRLSDAWMGLAAGDLPEVRSALSDLDLMVRAAGIDHQPAFPSPAGPGLGIANTEQNPADCRLLAGCEAIQTSAKPAISELVRSAPDGAAVALTEPKIATLVMADCFYAQDLSRTCGLKVIGVAQELQPGGRIVLRGAMGTEGPQRVLRLAGYELQTPAGPLPRPLGMPNRNVGGSGQGCLPGFLDGVGVWNGGLRVTVTGRVKSVASGCCYIDDGSGCADGTPNVGLRIVLLPGVDSPSSGGYVRATGISTWFDSTGLPEPAILVGANSDLAELSSK